MYGVESIARVFYLARCNGGGKPARTRLLTQCVGPRRGEYLWGPTSFSREHERAE